MLSLNAKRRLHSCRRRAHNVHRAFKQKNSRMSMRKEILNELMDAHRSIIELLNYDTTIPVLTGLKNIQENLLNIQKIITNGNE